MGLLISPIVPITARVDLILIQYQIIIIPDLVKKCLFFYLYMLYNNLLRNYEFLISREANYYLKYYKYVL